jgi:hypothetical protein
MLKQGIRGRVVAGSLMLLLAGLLVGCGGGGSGSPDLFMVAFLQDQRTNLYRDQVLSFEFTTTVDKNTVDLDTFRIFTGTTQNPTPFQGLFEVEGNFVYFRPVVDENTPNRGLVPINPYGFDENTTYQVKIPAVTEVPTPLKVLASSAGKPMSQAYSGVFSTGKEYRPTPNEANPVFEPFDAAVYDTRVPPVKGTPEPSDDVLTYTPVPNLVSPPVNPQTNQPDFRSEHPTNVQVQLTFTSVMDPRSFRAQAGGNVILEFNSPNSQDWNYIPTTVSHSPNGRTFVFMAATPLANEVRRNRFRLVIDQTTYPILSRGGKKLIEVVEKWDDTLQRMVRADVTEPDLTFWCALVAGETGPLLTSSFPLQSFAKDSGESDTDVQFGTGTLDAGAVVDRRSEDVTPCTQSYCNLALREPLTQSFTSPKPNPNTKGPSKVQFHFNSFQHVATPPTTAWKLTNAEALVGMNWGPLCKTVIKATYPKMHIHVMWSDRDSTSANSPAGLPSTTYNSNFDRNPPGFPVRDGTSPYDIDQSSASVTWYPWKFQQPFTDYRIDRGLVFMAWTEVGGDVEQYPRWYSPNSTPNTRIFSGPSGTVNPAVGAAGQFTYYWTEFEFKRMRSLAVSKFYRMTQNDNDRPLWNTVVVSPTPQNLPGGTDYRIEYRGARFSSYAPKDGGKYWEGTGTASQQSAWSTNISNMDELPAVAIRVVFTANLLQPQDLPYLDGIAFTFQLK